MSETKPHAGQKKFQKNSKYAKYDVSGDGVVDDEELELVKEINMVGFTGLLFSPIIPVERVNALGDLLGLYYIGQASVIGFYFGAQAYMSRK